MQASFKINLIPKITIVDPGDQIEIEIFLSGYGKIARNKLRIFYSPDLIDEKNPGVIESCIASARDKTGKFLQPVSGEKYLTSYDLKGDGVYIILEEGNFADYPQIKGIPSFGYTPIMSEYKWGSHPPLLLTINTSEKAPSGDYEVFVIFTYSDGTDVSTEKTSIPIHVRSSIERHQWKIAITGIITAITSPAWGEVISHLVKTYILPFI